MYKRAEPSDVSGHQTQFCNPHDLDDEKIFPDYLFFPDMYENREKWV